MKIRLHEIPEEGRQYIINRKTAELNADLADLIGNTPYDVQVFVRPINTRDFELTGTIQTATAEDCSRCGEDFSFKIDKKVHEILIPELEDDRTGKYAKSSTPISETEDFVTVSTYKNLQFELGDFVHEAIALEIPFNPAPACDMQGNCSVCHKNVGHAPFVYDEKMSEEVKRNPFQALKDIKID